MVDLGVLEAVLLVAMGGWLIVLGGAFLLSRRTVDRVSAILLALAGAYAILWQQPSLLGVGEAMHVAMAQPVFLFLLAGAIFLWSYWLFERHVEQLEAALEELSESLALEQVLVDVMSHDLRNTITTARLETQRLAQDDELAPRLEPIQSSLDQAKDVMEEGLTYSRLAESSDAAPMLTVDLAQRLENAVRSCRPAAERKDIDLDVRCPDRLVLQASPLIERLVENLLDNAIKFGPEGSTVDVRVRSATDRVTLTVADEGPGIPEEEREAVVDRFHRAPEEADDGSGLGLAIVRRLVDVHDGDLDIRDNDAGGATVEIQLPRRAPGTATRSRPDPTSTADGGVQAT